MPNTRQNVSVLGFNNLNFMSLFGSTFDKNSWIYF